jgi:hypothetical protein
MIKDNDFLATKQLEEVIEKYRYEKAISKVNIPYRNAIPLWRKAIDAGRHDCGYECRDSRMMQYTTLHGVCIAINDPKVIRVRQLSYLLGKDAMKTADEIKDAKTQDKLPFRPKTTNGVGKIVLWDENVKAEYVDLSEYIGVPEFLLCQIYSIRSMLQSSIRLGDTREYFKGVIVDWEKWLDQRAWDLYCLVENLADRERLISEYLKKNIRINFGDWFRE